MKARDEELYNKYLLGAKKFLDEHESGESELSEKACLDKLNKILREMRSMKEEAPDYKPTLTLVCLVRAFVGRGQLFLNKSWTMEALADFQAANKLMPNNEDIKAAIAGCYCNFGDQFLEHNDYAQALDKFSKAATLLKGNAEAKEIRAAIKKNIEICKYEMTEGGKRPLFFDNKKKEEGVLKPKAQKAQTTAPAQKLEGNEVKLDHPHSAFEKHEPKQEPAYVKLGAGGRGLYKQGGRHIPSHSQSIPTHHHHLSQPGGKTGSGRKK